MTVREEIREMCEVLKSRTTLEELREADEILQDVMVEHNIWSGHETPNAHLIVEAAQEVSRRIIHLEIGEKYTKEN